MNERLATLIDVTLMTGKEKEAKRADIQSGIDKVQSIAGIQKVLGEGAGGQGRNLELISQMAGMKMMDDDEREGWFGRQAKLGKGNIRLGDTHFKKTDSVAPEVDALEPQQRAVYDYLRENIQENLDRIAVTSRRLATTDTGWAAAAGRKVIDSTATEIETALQQMAEIPGLEGWAQRIAAELVPNAPKTLGAGDTGGGPDVEARVAEQRARIEKMKVEAAKKFQLNIDGTTKDIKDASSYLTAFEQQLSVAGAAQALGQSLDNMIEDFKKAEALFYTKDSSDLEGAFARVGQPGFKTSFEQRRDELKAKSGGGPRTLDDMRALRDEGAKIDFDEKEAKIKQKQDVEVAKLKSQQGQAEQVRSAIADALFSGDLKGSGMENQARGMMDTITQQLAESEQATNRGGQLKFKGIPALEELAAFSTKMKKEAQKKAQAAVVKMHKEGQQPTVTAIDSQTAMIERGVKAQESMAAAFDAVMSGASKGAAVMSPEAYAKAMAPARDAIASASAAMGTASAVDHLGMSRKKFANAGYSYEQKQGRYETEMAAFQPVLEHARTQQGPDLERSLYNGKTAEEASRDYGHMSNRPGTASIAEGIRNQHSVNRGDSMNLEDAQMMSDSGTLMDPYRPLEARHFGMTAPQAPLSPNMQGLTDTSWIPQSPALGPALDSPLFEKSADQMRADMLLSNSNGTMQTEMYMPPPSATLTQEQRDANIATRTAEFSSMMDSRSDPNASASFVTEQTLPQRDWSAEDAEFDQRMLRQMIDKGGATSYAPTGIDLKTDSMGAIAFSDQYGTGSISQDGLKGPDGELTDPTSNQVGMSNYNLVTNAQNALRFGNRNSISGAVQSTEKGVPGVRTDTGDVRGTESSGNDAVVEAGESTASAVSTIGTQIETLSAAATTALASVGDALATALASNPLQVEVTNTPTVNLSDSSLTSLSSALSTANVAGTGSDVTTGFDNRITAMESLVGEGTVDARIATGDAAVVEQIPTEETIVAQIDAKLVEVAGDVDFSKITTNELAITELTTATDTDRVNGESTQTDLVALEQKVSGFDATITEVTESNTAAKELVDNALGKVGDAEEKVVSLDEAVKELTTGLTAATEGNERFLLAAREELAAQGKTIKELGEKVAPIDPKLRELSDALSKNTTAINAPQVGILSKITTLTQEVKTVTGLAHQAVSAGKGK